MITRTQYKTYQFLKDFIAKYEYSPTTAEIAKGIGIRSRGVVHRYLKALQGAGLIHLRAKRHRNIEIIDASLPVSSLPLIGAIAAGQPIEAIEQQEAIDVVDIFLGCGRYALRVKGDSMVDEGIRDGDIVVCQKSDTASEGQIVVALIDNNEATLKRLFHNVDGTISLLSANSQYKPMLYAADRVVIQGIFVGLLRIS